MTICLPREIPLVEKQIEMIRVTAELGGKFCRTLSGQARREVFAEQGLDWVVQSIEACLPAAEKYDVNVVIENHYKDSYWQYREFAQKRERFEEIVNRIDSPYFGVQYDPSNALLAGDDPIEEWVTQVASRWPCSILFEDDG